MKKVFLFALAAVMMAGCGGDAKNPQEGSEQEQEYKLSTFSNVVKVVNIDSCEYIISHVNSGQVVVHKQNCRFCEQRRKAELREIVELLKDK